VTVTDHASASLSFSVVNGQKPKNTGNEVHGNEKDATGPPRVAFTYDQ